MRLSSSKPDVSSPNPVGVVLAVAAIGLLPLAWRLGWGAFQLGLLGTPLVIGAVLRFGMPGGLLAAGWVSGLTLVAARWFSDHEHPPSHLVAGTLYFFVLAVALGLFVSKMAKHRESLARQEDFLRRAQEISDTGIWAADRAAGSYTWSDQLHRILGLEPGKVAPSRVAFLQQVHPEDRSAVAAAHAVPSVSGLSGHDLEYRLVDPDTGTVRYVHERCQHTVDPGNPGALRRSVGTVQDVTARRRMAERVRGLLQEYESIFHGTQDAMFLVEVCEQGVFRYIRTNDAHARLTGVSTEAIEGKTPQDLVGKEIGATIVANYQRCLDQGAPITYEEVIQLPGGLREWQTTLTPVSHSGDLMIVGASTDITARKRMEQALSEREAQLQAVIQSTADGVMATDLDGEVLVANDRFFGLWEMPAHLSTEQHNAALREHAMEMLVDPEAFLDRLAQIYAGEDEAYDLLPLRGGRVLERYSRPLSENGQVTGRVWSLRDVTERSRYEEQLVQLSLHDQLTGVYNRAFFAQELARVERAGEYPVTLIAVDVDGLKLINDTVGHDRGDALLTTCVELLRQALRRHDVIARVGGDEFAIILPHTSATHGERLQERIRAQIAKHNAQGEGLPVAVSLGSATAESTETSLDSVLKLADARMYRDKQERGPETRTMMLGALLAPLDSPSYAHLGHVERLSEVCLELGMEIGLPAEQLADLLLLTKVHDIGMVGVPDSVILDERPLSDADWDLVSLHPEKGHRIALASKDLAAVAELILRHHERWDGSGYPGGLRGEDIPLICRIFAVADAFEAMLQDRPYRRAKTLQEAIWEVQRCSGTQFDPLVVEVFMRLVRGEDPAASATDPSSAGRVVSLDRSPSQ